MCAVETFAATSWIDVKRPSRIAAVDVAVGRIPVSRRLQCDGRGCANGDVGQLHSLRSELRLNGPGNSAHWLDDLLLKAGHQSDRLNV